MPDRHYLALWSYVRDDDEGEGGCIARLHELVVNELRMQTGRDLAIFLDRKELIVGEHWQARLDQAIRDSLFLIPTVTPNYFNSVACRWELEQFLAKEEGAGRDLILPLYYMSAVVVDDAGLRATNRLAKIIRSRQYSDWRDLRSEPLTSRIIKDKIIELAGQIVTRWEREEKRRLLSSPVAARIVAPNNDARCRHRVDLTIEINVPDDSVRLWLASRGQRPDEPFHLHGRALLTTDRRQTLPVFLGRTAAGADNRPFDIMLAAQTLTMSRHFEQYRQDVEQRREWPGLPSLLGARILHSIQVVRHDS